MTAALIITAILALVVVLGGWLIVRHRTERPADLKRHRGDLATWDLEMREWERDNRKRYHR